MLSRPTVHLSWDDLDAQGCGEDGAPDWSSLVVVGPTKRRDSRGRVTLVWSVTVQCQEPSVPRTPGEE
jgi:hypothetical protein